MTTRSHRYLNVIDQHIRSFIQRFEIKHFTLILRSDLKRPQLEMNGIRLWRKRLKGAGCIPCCVNQERAIGNLAVLGCPGEDPIPDKTQFAIGEHLPPQWHDGSVKGVLGKKMVFVRRVDLLPKKTLVQVWYAIASHENQAICLSSGVIRGAVDKLLIGYICC